jgi:hypothetical protein
MTSRTTPSTAREAIRWGMAEDTTDASFGRGRFSLAAGASQGRSHDRDGITEAPIRTP